MRSTRQVLGSAAAAEQHSFHATPLISVQPTDPGKAPSPSAPQPHTQPYTAEPCRAAPEPRRAWQALRPSPQRFELPSPRWRRNFGSSPNPLSPPNAAFPSERHLPPSLLPRVERGRRTFTRRRCPFCLSRRWRWKWSLPCSSSPSTRRRRCAPHRRCRRRSFPSLPHDSLLATLTDAGSLAHLLAIGP